MIPQLIHSLILVAAGGYTHTTISFILISLSATTLPSLFEAITADTPVLLSPANAAEPPTRSIPSSPSASSLIQASTSTKVITFILVGVVLVGVGSAFALLKPHLTTSPPPVQEPALTQTASTHPVDRECGDTGYQKWLEFPPLALRTFLYVSQATSRSLNKFAGIAEVRISLSPHDLAYYAFNFLGPACICLAIWWYSTASVPKCYRPSDAEWRRVFRLTRSSSSPVLTTADVARVLQRTLQQVLDHHRDNNWCPVIYNLEHVHSTLAYLCDAFGVVRDDSLDKISIVVIDTQTHFVPPLLSADFIYSALFILGTVDLALVALLYFIPRPSSVVFDPPAPAPVTIPVTLPHPASRVGLKWVCACTDKQERACRQQVYDGWVDLRASVQKGTCTAEEIALWHQIAADLAVAADGPPEAIGAFLASSTRQFTWIARQQVYRKLHLEAARMRRAQLVALWQRFNAEPDAREAPPPPVPPKPFFDAKQVGVKTIARNRPFAHFDADGRSTGFRRD